MHDPENPKQATHGLRNLATTQRCGLYCGHENLNHHNQLRQAPQFQPARGWWQGSGPDF
ncbi:MAG: hypothetical protein GXZ05_13100 [Gammaproteobacteria bacterium]|nr:hypothetical protein [Gammaproteobacteria bacterium]